MSTRTVIGAEVKVTGLNEAGASVGTLRKQIKEATNDLHTMADQFGLTSKQAQDAAKKVAELRDRMGDARALTETFNPDKKFVALGGSVQGVTAGFTAFSGTMGLLGDKSKETEELLLRVQSAMAFQQGLSGLKSSIDSFKLLGNAIKSSTAFQQINNAATVAAAAIQRAFGITVVETSGAFNILKNAIIATGIGALVVLVGVVISKLDLFGDKTKEAADQQEEMKAATDRLNESFNDEIDALNRLSGFQLKQAQIAGKTDKELFDIQKDNIDKRIELRYDELKAAQKAGLSTTEILKQKAKDEDELANLRLDFDLKQANAAREASKKAAEERAADDEKHKQDLKKLLEQLAKLRAEGRTKEQEAIQAYGAMLAEVDKGISDAEIERLKTNEQKRLETKAALAEQAVLDDPDSVDNKIAKINADFELEMSTFDGNEIVRQNKIKQHNAEVLAIKTDAAATELALQQNKHDQELSAAGGALGALSDLIGRQTAVGKTLAIAEATINTFKAGLQVFAQPMPGIPPVSLAVKIASMVAAIAGGIVTVKKIVSTPVPGNGGGGSVPSLPSLPNAPIPPRPQTTTLDQQSIQAVGNAANRSYVLETDVSGNQERVRRLNRAARIN